MQTDEQKLKESHKHTIKIIAKISLIVTVMIILAIIAISLFINSYTFMVIVDGIENIIYKVTDLHFDFNGNGVAAHS